MPAKKTTLKEPESIPEPEKKNTKFAPEVIIAIIGLIGTIVTAIVAPIIVENWKSNTATPTATVTEILTTQITDTPAIVAQGFTPIVSPGDVINSKGVVMAYVPAGKFTMGSDNGRDDEKPPHEVYLDAYYIDKYEVTNSLYKACVDTGICKLPSDIRKYDDPKYANHPVVYVDWDMAQTYCEWQGTRLPTEAEWEKAARGTDDRIYPWGDTASCELANYGNCVGDSTEVGQYKDGASPNGIYDMGGNVWEWVSDWYLSDYYQILEDSFSNPRGPTLGEEKVYRGGDWDDGSQWLRVSVRDGDNPAPYSQVGFRCARSETTSATATAIVTLTASAAELNLRTNIVDGKKVAMVLVPAGEFTMGTDNEDAGSDAQPSHPVYLNAFYIDKFEVTNVLYKACINAKVCDPPTSTDSSTRENYFGNSEFDNYPVVAVDWFMAETYCEWRDARLPTEAEWEKAARGTDERTYPWGEEIDKSFANFNLNIGDTVAVGSYESGKSFYGVYDMAGNVWEWVADWYASGYYKVSPFEMPLGPELGKYRVFRGGAYYISLDSVKTFYRDWNEPVKSYVSVGFRCAKDATP